MGRGRNEGIEARRGMKEQRQGGGEEEWRQGGGEGCHDSETQRRREKHMRKGEKDGEQVTEETVRMEWGGGKP